MTNYKLCVKSKRYELCIKPKKYIDKYDKNRIYDRCIHRKDRCQCIQKKYCTQYKEYKRKKSCQNFEKISLKCSSSSKNTHIKH